jgi:hypothetical protein
VESFYLAFGTTDVYVVVDAPGHETMAAIAGTVTSTGALSDYETVVLLSPAEVDRAAEIAVDYTPPGG